MSLFITKRLMPGVYWVEVQEIGLRVLCGCPADAVKHLYKHGMIQRIHREGIRSETGPNTILLSDLALQNGNFSNMAEFPILQILYLQGMLLPGHPANTGERPLLVGTPEQVQAQMRYIHRGIYGLLSTQELLDAGASAQQADELMRTKLFFAFGKINPSETLIKPAFLEDAPITLQGGATLKRITCNVFEFNYQGESVQVDLNLGAGERYVSPFEMPAKHVPRHRFAVVHTGEGDGWDAQRPAMASVIMHLGRWYLVDAGPSILQTVKALGLGLHEIEGVFHTHAHDDHFAGLVLLMQAERPLKYYAVPWVRESMVKKCQALTGWSAGVFPNLLEFVDLQLDAWNDVQGLLVRPRLSPHPVETTFFEFQADVDEGPKTYTHLADICSFEVLDRLGELPLGLGAERVQEIKQQMLAPADVKKIDIGGGLIHGQAEDFKSDASTKIRLAHTYEPLNATQEAVGALARFAEVDVLWPALRSDKSSHVLSALLHAFAQLPKATLRRWATGLCIRYAAGDTLVSAEPQSPHVLMIVSGLARQFHTGTTQSIPLYAGSVIGETWPHQMEPAHTHCVAESIVEVLLIPLNEFMAYVPSTAAHRFNADGQAWWDWSSHDLFCEALTRPTRHELASLLRRQTWLAGDVFDLWATDQLFLLTQGQVDIVTADHIVCTRQVGQFFGSAQHVHGNSNQPLYARVVSPVCAYCLPAQALLALPVCRWKIMSERMKYPLKPPQYQA